MEAGMKSFYEMLEIIRKSKINEVSDDYGAGAYHDDHDVFFSAVLGEDEGDPFSLEVDIENGHWTSKGSIWVAGYVINGSENPASKPKALDGGTEFSNPGKRLELLPLSIKNKAIEWVDKQVQWKVDHYKPEDPRDYEEPEPREWDDEDQANYDRKLYGFDKDW